MSTFGLLPYRDSDSARATTSIKLDSWRQLGCKFSHVSISHKIYIGYQNIGYQKYEKAYLNSLPIFHDKIICHGFIIMVSYCIKNRAWSIKHWKLF